MRLCDWLPRSLFPLVTLFILAGCHSVSPTAHRDDWTPPKAGVASFTAPDGRTWIETPMSGSMRNNYRHFLLPGADEKKPMELLTFVLSAKLSPEEIRRVVDDLVHKHQATVQSTLEEIAPATTLFIIHYDASGTKGRSIAKIVKTERGYLAITYENRLGPEGDARFEQWKKFIRASHPESITFPAPLLEPQQSTARSPAFGS